MLPLYYSHHPIPAQCPEYVERIMPILNEYKEIIINGALITIRSDGKIKTRLLPIIIDGL